MNKTRKAVLAALTLTLAAAHPSWTAEDSGGSQDGPVWHWFGTLRMRPEYNDNLSDANSARDDKIGYASYRANLGMQVDLDRNVSVVMDLQALGAWGEDQTPVRGSQTFSNLSSDVGLFHAYARAEHIFDTQATISAGRMPLVFGDEWIMGDSDFYGGTSWDGVRADFDSERHQISAFWAKGAELDRPEFAAFTPDFSGDFDLYGIWTTWKFGDKAALDGAAIYAFDHRDAPTSLVTFTDKRMTYHARFNWEGDTGLFVNMNGAIQRGTTALTASGVGVEDIKAGAAELTGGWKWQRGEKKLPYRVWLRVAHYDGDDPATPEVETFNPLAQDNHLRYGVLDWWNGSYGFVQFLGGSLGYEVLQAGFSATVTNGIRIIGILQKNKSVELPSTTNSNRNLGEDFGLSVSSDYGKNVTVELGFGQTYPGAEFRSIGPTFASDTVRRIYCNTIIRF